MTALSAQIAQGLAQGFAQFVEQPLLWVPPLAACAAAVTVRLVRMYVEQAIAFAAEREASEIPQHSQLTPDERRWLRDDLISSERARLCPPVRGGAHG